MASAGEMFQTVLRNDARAIELLMQWWHRKWQTLISDFAGPENLRMRVVLVISVVNTALFALGILAVMLWYHCCAGKQKLREVFPETMEAFGLLEKPGGPDLEASGDTFRARLRASALPEYLKAYVAPRANSATFSTPNTERVLVEQVKSRCALLARFTGIHRWMCSSRGDRPWGRAVRSLDDSNVKAV